MPNFERKYPNHNCMMNTRVGEQPSGQELAGHRDALDLVHALVDLSDTGGKSL